MIPVSDRLRKGGEDDLIRGRNRKVVRQTATSMSLLFLRSATYLAPVYCSCVYYGEDGYDGEGVL